jgi:hydroxyacylglutathione hydrolase
MIVETLVVGLIQTNCYVIAEESTREGAIVDPGGDADQILGAVDRLQLQVKYVANTHAHFDHTLANGQVMRGLDERQKTPPSLVTHPAAAPLLTQGGGARWFGIPSMPSPEPDLLVNDGDVLPLGHLSFQVLHTPGHSPGSISLYCAAEKVLFDGDVLFRQGVGRTDLPGGHWNTLLHSIQNRLFVLPDDTVVYSGHGPSTTIGWEKRANPFLR